MSIRTAKSRHLGERRFLEYPQFVADELGLTGDFAQRLLAKSPFARRRALAATLLLLVVVALAWLLLLG